ncbi:retrotransposon protein, putative, ty1-copia subclass [Tanacetum coccineum]
MDGNVHTFKAHLVAKGYTKTYGVDYRETFSPVADIRAIRILLAIAAFYPKHPNKVCKLQRSIYRLKQASRSWNKRFDVEIKKIGLTQNPNEPYVYLKSGGSNVAFLILYVDDILLMGNNVTMLEIPKEILDGNSKKGYTPMIEKPDYRKSKGDKTPSEVQRMQIVHYASDIVSIMYAVRSILKYLRNTKDMFLVYGAKPKVELKVSCYADASFQTDKDDTKSQIGYVFVLNGEAID